MKSIDIRSFLSKNIKRIHIYKHTHNHTHKHIHTPISTNTHILSDVPELYKRVVNALVFCHRSFTFSLEMLEAPALKFNELKASTQSTYLCETSTYKCNLVSSSMTLLC